MMRLGGRRTRDKLRDRGDMPHVRNASPSMRYTYSPNVTGPSPSPSVASPISAANHQPSSSATMPALRTRGGGADSNTIRFTWGGGEARSVALVASFDGFMHHRMQRIPLGHRSGPTLFDLTIRVPPGSFTYKFLVDGVWRTDPDAARTHPIAQLPDGTSAHQLEVSPSTSCTLGPYGVHGRGPVRSSSVSDLHRVSGAPSGNVQVELGSQRSFTSLHTTSRGTPASSSAAAHHDRNDRPSSFMAMSASASPAQRKSLLPRFGSNWMRRFSGRHLSNVSDVIDADVAPGGAHVPVCAPMTPDKENANVLANGGGGGSNGGTPRKWRPALRASTRSQPISISGPTAVDQPHSAADVHRNADSWRHMAKELQENLHDPAGARSLLEKAVRHREQHGLWCTIENAQIHVDLARNLSKCEFLADAERHLRVALRIYKLLDSGPEHVGDLLHYIGVVVDRQKKRVEAEELYRAALATYRENRLTGSNVEIAIKNLTLNLRKQGREQDAQLFLDSYAHSHHRTIAA